MAFGMRKRKKTPMVHKMAAKLHKLGENNPTDWLLSNHLCWKKICG